MPNTVIFTKIIDLLGQHNVSYEILEHEPVHTSADAARVRDTDLAQGAKALVMYGDGNPLLIVVPANKRASFKKIKKFLEVKDLRMATPEEVEDLTTLKVGSIPPTGSVIGLTSYFDKEFLDKDKVVFNAGMLTASVLMSAKDLIVVEKPRMFDIVD